MKISRLLMVITLIFVTTSCTTKITDYSETNNDFILEEYFNGPVIAWGMLQDYTDEVTRRFCVEIEGSWRRDNDKVVGELNEWFYFDDGEVSQRIWTLTKTKKNTYVGQAGDVSGQAEGQTSGFAFQWQYTLQVDIDENSYEFFLDDWMYQLDEHRVFNRTSMQKFGVEVAEITLFFDKQAPLRSCQTSDT